MLRIIQVIAVFVITYVGYRVLDEIFNIVRDYLKNKNQTVDTTKKFETKFVEDNDENEKHDNQKNENDEDNNAGG